MVENVNWSFAKMACLLPAVNRWCVTGTPIPNGLQGMLEVDDSFVLLSEVRPPMVQMNCRFVWSRLFPWNRSNHRRRLVGGVNHGTL